MQEVKFCTFPSGTHFLLKKRTPQPNYLNPFTAAFEALTKRRSCSNIFLSYIFFCFPFFFWFSFGICFIFHHPPGSPNIDPVTVTFQPTSLQWFPPFCDLFWGLVLLHIVV